MVLREKLNGTKMTKTETVTSYLTRISQARDELADVGETVTSAELVRIALKGFVKPWEYFVQGIVARETMPSWERLWDDFVQEEMRKDSSSTSQHHVGDDEENVALFTKGKKKAKKSGLKGGPKGGAKQLKEGEQKKDMSKVKCYACHKMGHYVGQCPHRKKKQVATFVEVDDFISQFDGQFCLSTCLASSSTVTSTWYIDSGATCHMFGVREHFFRFYSDRGGSGYRVWK